MVVPWEHLAIRNSRPAVEAEAIDAVAKKIGLPFPPEYVEFLLAHNGGSFRPWPRYAIEGCPRDSAGLLQCFFNVGTSDSVDLLGEYKTHRRRMPSGLLPIASDPGGNLICLACTGEQAGRVYFWERAHEANTDEGEVVGWTNVFKISDSFPAFLFSLRV
jgi:cell wall assembly regulator SMI1